MLPSEKFIKNTLMKTKLQNISAILRWLVILTISILLIYSAYNYFTKGIVTFGTDPRTFNLLWQNPNANRTILTLFLLPSIILVLSFGYWLQKLLFLFHKGDFFTEDNIHCFLWLVWLNFAAGIYGVFGPALLGSYGHDIDPTVYPKFIFEIISILTMVLLVAIAHLMKAARQIELENKEFI